MEIRKLDQLEHMKTRSLYEEVFPEDSASFVTYYYEEKARDNQIYVLEESGEIKAMVHLNPYEMYVNGQVNTAHYIVAVATKESSRRKGYMGVLLRQCMNDMREAGESFTFLMPAAEAIYRPYDFRTVYEQQPRYYETTESLQSDTQVREAKAEDADALVKAANCYLTEHYQVFARRDRTYYERLRKEYLSQDSKLMVYEADEKIIDCRPWVKEVEAGLPKIMVRILHLDRMLMSLSLRSNTAVCFEIIDPIIASNNRCVMLTGTQFSGVKLTKGKREQAEGVLTIRALTSLVFGEMCIEELCKEEGVSMSERMKQELQNMIVLSAIYMNELV